MAASASQATQQNASTDALETVAAAPSRGFFWPYLLHIPDSGERRPIFPVLLVEPNNTGKASDAYEEHVAAAKSLVRTGLGGRVSAILYAPILMPVFPRAQGRSDLYTHMLDRDTMLVSDGPLRRLDLQLLAMIVDARDRLLARNIPVRDKVLLTGFSASGKFVNRFVMLHPEHVFAAAAGGVSGLVMLPLDKLSGTRLTYPLGIADIETIAARSFDRRMWSVVPQFIFMGAEDRNDALRFDDGYSSAERSAVYRLFGERMFPDRWRHCQELYETFASEVTFRTYDGLRHGTNGSVHADVASFFKLAVARAETRSGT